MPYIGQRPTKGDENNFKILDDISSYTLTFDGSDSSVVSAANDTITSLNHRFVQGQRVTYNKGGGTVITGLSDGVYYIIKEDHNTIKLATSASNASNGVAVNITGVGVGSSHTLNVAFDGINTKFKATHTNGVKARITRSAQLVISINGVIQQPHDTATPSTGFGFDLDGTIVFSQAPVSTDEYWAHVLTNNNVTFDISNNDIDNFTGDGSTTEFNLSKSPPDNRNVLVTIDGVVQYPNDPNGTVRAYVVVENVLTFNTAPTSGVEIQVRHIGFAGSTSGSGGVTNFYGRTGAVVLKNTDNITVNDAAITGDATVTGNLTIDGDFTTLNTTLREVELLHVDANSTASAGIITQTGSGNILGLFDGSAEVFTVRNGGEVKISSNVNALSAPSVAGNYHLHITNPQNDAGQTVGIAFGLSTGGDIGAAITHEREGSNSFGNLRFYTKQNANSATMLERMRITKDGKIGIGSASPTHELEVLGDFTLKSGSATVKASILSDTALTSHSYLHSFDGSNPNGLTIKTNEAMLELIGDAGGTHAGSLLIRDSSNDGFGFVNDPTNEELQLKSFTTSADNFRINSTGENVSRLDDCIVIKKDGSVKLFNDGNLRLETTAAGVSIGGTSSTMGGKLGIGTDSPGSYSKLTVAAPGGAGVGESPIIEIKRTTTNGGGAASYGGINWTALDGHSVATIYAVGDGDDNGADILFKTTSDATSNTPYQAANKTRLRINSTGEVLIGNLLHTANSEATGTLIVDGGDSNIGGIQVHAGGGENVGDLAGISFSHGNSGTASRPKAAIALEKQNLTSGRGDLCFYVDGTNDNNKVSTTDERLRITSDGKVGIGTDNPDSNLTIHTTTPGENVFNIHSDLGSNNNRTFNLYAPATDSGDDPYIFKTGNSMQFKVDSHEGIKIDTNGAVGIGTTNPSALLHLHGSSPQLYFTDTDTNVLSQIDCDSTAGNFAINVDVNNSAGSDSNFLVRFNETHPVSAAKFLVNQTGNVGINSGSPQEKLVVHDGNVLIRRTTGGGHLTLQTSIGNGNDIHLVFKKSRGSSGALTVVQDADDLGTIQAQGYSGNAGNFKTAASIRFEVDGEPDTSGDNSDMPGRILFQTTPNSAGSTQERLRITGGGNIGIGITNPDTPLHIYKNDATLITAERSTNQNAGIRYKNTVASMFAGLTSNANGWAVNSAEDLGSNPMFIVERTSGKVGIGLTNPESLLHLSAGEPIIRLSKSDGATDNKHWNIAANTANLLRIQALNDAASGGGNLFDFYRSGNSVQEFRGMNGGNYWFTINNDTKKVGIGITNPGYILEIGNILSNNNIKIGNRITDSNYGIAYGYYDNLSGDHGFGIDLKNGGTLTTNAFVVRADTGNVGINQANPTSKLVVEGGAYTVGNSGRSVHGIDIQGDSGDVNGNFGGAISFGVGDVGRSAIAALQDDDDADNTGLSFFVHTSNTGTADAEEKMRLDGDGILKLGSNVSTDYDTDNDTLIQLSSSDGPRITFVRTDTTTSGGEVLGRLNFNSVDQVNNTCATIFAQGSQTHSSTQQGSDIIFQTTKNGTLGSAMREVLRISDSGDISVNSTGPLAHAMLTLANGTASGTEEPESRHNTANGSHYCFQIDDHHKPVTGTLSQNRAKGGIRNDIEWYGTVGSGTNGDRISMYGMNSSLHCHNYLWEGRGLYSQVTNQATDQDANCNALISIFGYSQAYQTGGSNKYCNIYGGQFLGYRGGDVNSGTCYGVYARSQVIGGWSGGAGNPTGTHTGVYAEVENDSNGTMASAYALRAVIDADGTGTITDAYHLRGTYHVEENATITNKYGIVLEGCTSSNIAGDLHIGGSLSKGGGSFRIPHPLPALKDTKDLVHSFVEGPQMDLIYRGKVDLVDGTATINIDTKAGMTEGTFVALCRDIQCFTSNETGWTAVKGSVTGNILTIIAQENTCTDTISWMVVGERQDDTIKSLTMTDDNGDLIVEPDKIIIPEYVQPDAEKNENNIDASITEFD